MHMNWVKIDCYTILMIDFYIEHLLRIWVKTKNKNYDGILLLNFMYDILIFYRTNRNQELFLIVYYFSQSI